MAEENMEKKEDGQPDEAADTRTGEENEAVREEEAAKEKETSKEDPKGDGQAGEDAAEQPKDDADSQKQEKKDKKDIQIEELQDRVKRQMAEFENFRKRSEKEKAGMFELGAKSVIEQLLPIVDNFERGLGALSEEGKADPFADGMEKVYRQMTEMLQKIGVQAIEAVGCEFNPDFHNAVMHVDDEESPDNTVVEEFLKGYTYKDQVVRHSMVKVAN